MRYLIKNFEKHTQLVYKTTKSSESSGDSWQFCSIFTWLGEWDQSCTYQPSELTAGWWVGRFSLELVQKVPGFWRLLPEKIWELSQGASGLDHQIATSLRTSSNPSPCALSWAIPIQQGLALGLASLQTELTHLLIVPDFIVQDDAIGLLWLWPWQGDAPHGGTDLVHDRNSGRGCGEGKRQRDKHTLNYMRSAIFHR